MGNFTHLYCGLWGVPNCQFFALTDAVRLVLGTFAIACLLVWASGFGFRRR
jgi:hypothetical protein